MRRLAKSISRIYVIRAALLLALWFIVSTVREVVSSHEELIWPEEAVCGHPEDKEAVKAK